MTAKLSPDSIGLIFTMHAAGHQVSNIADAAGCSCSTVVRYLNQAGIVLGNKGRKRELTEDYLNMALDLRAKGKTWAYIESRIGFCRKTFQAWIRAKRVQSAVTQ